MNWSGCRYVEIVSEKLHGVPVIVNSRVPADGVVENHLDGMSADDIAKDFGLDVAVVRGVLEYASVLRGVPMAVSA